MPRVIRRKKRTSADSPTSWGSVADWYDKMLGDGAEGTYQHEVILPNLLRHMAIKEGEHVVDLGCGQGFFSAAFVQAGATIMGADIAPELVKIAKRKVLKGKFFAAPAESVPEISTAWAAQIALVLALQNMEHEKAVFTECQRILAPGGKVHLVLNHPCFRIPKRSSWGWDMHNKQYRRIDGYLTESRNTMEMHPGADPTIHTVSFHRSLQQITKALVRSGFVITNLEEWVSHKQSDSGPRAKEENRARKEFPLFMYIAATRT